MLWLASGLDAEPAPYLRWWGLGLAFGLGLLNKYSVVFLGVGLGVVLTLQLLAGLPLIPVFTYQLIALRALWEQPAVRKWTLEAEAAPAIRRYDDLL